MNEVSARYPILVLVSVHPYPMVCLEHDIRRAQVNKETVLAVLFDVEKAYDMVWRQGLLIKIKQLGIRGRVFQWIRDFLTERKIAVKVDGTLSRCYEVENGTPQGSIISPLLFSIAINDIFKDLDRSTEVALFADDGALWRRGKNMGHVVGRMQQAISNVEKWAFDWGFRFSVDKTKMYFTRRKINEEFKIKLYGRVREGGVI